MYNHSRVEFINFDYEAGIEPDQPYEIDSMGIDMGKYVLDRKESDFDIMMCDSRSQISINSDIPNYGDKSNISISIDNASFYSAEGNMDKRNTKKGNKCKPFQCGKDKCHKKSKFKWILERHMSSHDSVRLFKCMHEDCLKSYKSNENLTLPTRNIHLKERPYHCKYCDSTFTHRYGKTYHERKFHTFYLPHKCVFKDCDQCFASKSALTYDVKSAHSSKNTIKKSNISPNRLQSVIIESLLIHTHNSL